mgnify:CR=1 FL=1
MYTSKQNTDSLTLNSDRPPAIRHALHRALLREVQGRRQASRVQPSFYGAMIHHCMNKIKNRLITSYPNGSVICIVKYFLTTVKIEILLANLF